MDLKNSLQKRKTFWITIGIIIVCFVILFGVLYFWVSKLPSLPESVFKIPAKDEEKALAEFRNCLDESKEPILDVENDQKDQYYIIAKALMEEDKGICVSLLEKEKDQNYCLKNFYEFMAMINNDDSYCKKITDSPSDSQICFAIVNEDLSYCDQVEPLLYQEICRAAVLGPEYCDNLSGSYDSKNVCTRIEGLEGFEETCGQISEEEAKLHCRNSAYLVKALKNKDYETCQAIDFGTGHFARLFCIVLTSSEPQKEWRSFYNENRCYEKHATVVAKIKNDSSLCEKIPLKESYNQKEYQRCIDQFK